MRLCYRHLVEDARQADDSNPEHTSRAALGSTRDYRLVAEHAVAAVKPHSLYEQWERGWRL